MEHDEVREAQGLPSAQEVLVPAGWYPDPGSSESQRYWDGLRWTTHTFPSASNEQIYAMPLAASISTPARAETSIISPRLRAHPTFLIAAVLWGVAAIWGLATPFIVKAVQMAQSRAMFDTQIGTMADEERLLGQVLGQANDNMTSWVTGPIYTVWMFLGFVGLLGYAFVLYFLFRGSVGARIAATVLSGISVSIILTAGIVSIVHVLLNVAATILIWMPGSTSFLACARSFKLMRGL